MPRNLKPDALKTGSGKRVPDKGNTVVLGGAGMTGPGPNIGQAAWVDSAEGVKNLPAWVRQRLNSSGMALSAHESSTSAHPASSITFKKGELVDGLEASTVESALISLHGAFPDEPPNIGEWRNPSASVLSGITDWGALKVEDRDLITRGALAGVGSAAADQVYPYFYKAPSPLIAAPDLSDTPFNDHGGDPQTDDEWNSGMTGGVDMYGVGTGVTKVGGYTRDGSLANQEVMRTAALFQNYTLTDAVTGLALRREVTISGMVYPADRGVLALIHWPAGTTNNGAPDVADFLAQDLLDRCVAALLLGQGILGAECIDPTGCTTTPCDGEAGGIFSVGQDADGNYDPFTFPGRATGQYDLSELHTGVNGLDGAALHDPFGGGIPVVRAFYGTDPAPGQVRLGTDPNSGVADPTGFGIPILGAGMEAYDAGSPPGDLANINGARIGHVVIGNSIVQMEDPVAPGTRFPSTNFFRYRLPYLKTYDSAGLKWTPKGDDFTNSREQWRYFERAVPSANAGLLTRAGNYNDPFDEDNINWQIARYRHSFLLPSTGATDDVTDAGSYWLIHFKKEADFEAFVRDGVMPWDATNGYDVYGVDTFDTANHAEDDGNVVNEVSSAGTYRSPYGPASDYGYVSQSYFPRRSTVVLAPDHDAFTATGTFDWSIRAPSESIMFVSGVAYWQPRRNTGVSAGDPNFDITDISITEGTTTFFGSGFSLYRTADYWAAGNALDPVNVPTDPALISSPSPAFITFFPFAYGPHPSSPTDQLFGPSATFPLDPDTANGLSNYQSARMPSRVEIPYTHLGPGGVNQYSESNGPKVGDSLTISLGAGADIVLHGDDDEPSFTMHARPRAFFRRPFKHRNSITSTEPYAANDGHGIIVEPMDDAEILMHTSRFDDVNQVGRFSNQMQGLGTPDTGYSAHFTADKDTFERFLDEQYRYSSTFDHDTADPSGVSSIAGVGATGLAALAGPGLAGYGGGAIEVPVRAGLTNTHSTNWAYSAWTPMGINTQSLDALVGDSTGDELQVVGWPDRNPPLSDRVDAPYPSTGLLIYPRRDYSTVGSPSIRPSGPLGAGDFATEQPDYTPCAGLREYVRCFDASFGGTVAAAGQPFVTIRLDGVTLSDIGYTAPGPGSLNRADINANTFLAVLLKVPGLTTWMDVGRVDGGGPSKQDNVLDGAGCQVVGPETFDGIDPDSGIVYCQIKCNVGPAVNLFASTGIEGTTVGEVPVLVKVQMQDTATALDMAHDFDGTDFTGPVPGPGTSYSRLRGLCGIRVVDPT
jgi:hypothetical protein